MSASVICTYDTCQNCRYIRKVINPLAQVVGYVCIRSVFKPKITDDVQIIDKSYECCDEFEQKEKNKLN